MADWPALCGELDAWAAAGRRATLWWRDDDAEAPSPALDRLLALARRHRVPLALAVVPAGAGEALAERLAAAPEAVALSHGLDHRNLAPAGARKSEFGPDRPVAELLADAATGWNRLKLLLGAAALPVFVPPWNRMAPALVPRLGDAGLKGLSAFGPRLAAEPAPELVQSNCHVDLIDWRGTRGFVGEAAALGSLVAHLAARREGRVDAEEPSGIMSHHLRHDPAAWRFLERVLDETTRHESIHWLSAREVFRLAP